LQARFLTVKAPDLGDPQDLVNLHSIQKAAADLDLYRKIRRRVTRQVDTPSPLHLRKIDQVIALIRLQAAQEILALVGKGTKAADDAIQLFGQNEDQHSDQTLEPFVGGAEDHKLQTPAIVGQMQIPIR
jgi:hypothetical protein